MHISPLNKTLAAVGMLLFFTFGAIAVSLAHDLPPSGPSHVFALRDLLKNRPVGLDTYALSFGIECEAAKVPESAQPDLDGHPLLFSRWIEPPKVSFPVQPHALKVSLQILESVLLI